MEQESQKREVEQTGCQPPSAPVLCPNNCGFYGTASTNNLCSKCYKEFILKQAKAAAAEVVVEKKVDETLNETIVQEVKATPCEEASSSEDPGKLPANRCSFCRKRVGLTGFKCRCQDLIARANPVVKADKVDKI